MWPVFVRMAWRGSTATSSMMHNRMAHTHQRYPEVRAGSPIGRKTKVKRCLSAHCRSRCLSAHCSTRVALRFLCSTCDRQRPSRRSSTLRYTCCAKASRGAPTIEWVSVLGQDAGTRGAALSSVMGYAKSAEPLSVVLSCFL